MDLGEREEWYERLFSWIEKGSTRGFSRGERRVVREIILVDRNKSTRGYSRGSGREREKDSTRNYSRG